MKVPTFLTLALSSAALATPYVGQVTFGHEPHPMDWERSDGQTIYEVIKTSSPTNTAFVAWVDEFDDIVQLLKSTNTNSTIFLPSDDAVRAFLTRSTTDQLSKTTLKKLVQHHISPGWRSAESLRLSQTIPTYINESRLGNFPQRLQIKAQFPHFMVNRQSNAETVDVFTKNGVIHYVDSVIELPGRVDQIMELYPNKFSTILYGVVKTDAGDGTPSLGGTVFAPSNKAFSQLGEAANEFLFNTEQGLDLLRVLLQFHVAEYNTLYSDKYYFQPGKHFRPKTESDEEHVYGIRQHFDLESLVANQTIRVDSVAWPNFATMVINDAVTVDEMDYIGLDGVFHVLDTMLLPPHKDYGIYRGGKVGIDELTARLGPLIEV